MNDAEDFDAFVAIVDSRSISEAAREMGVPRATLSRQLARLEERLGVRLLHRGTRSLTPTQAGEALYPRARALLDGARATVTAVRRIDDVPRGLVRVTAPPLVSPMLGMLISAFIRDNPDVQVEFRTSTEHFDLAAEQIDIAIRAGVVRDPSLIVRRLFRSDMLAMAAPSYLQDRGHPADVTDLSRHLCLLKVNDEGAGFVPGNRCNIGHRPKQQLTWVCLGFVEHCDLRCHRYAFPSVAVRRNASEISQR